MILGLIDKAVSNGARLQKAAAIAGLSARCVIRWRQSGVADDRRTGSNLAPSNKLSEHERMKIV